LNECDKVLFSLKLNNDSLINSQVVMIDNLPVLHLADLKNDTYHALVEKMFLTLKYVNRHHGDYDWYMKADVNTFVFMDHLRSFLKDYDPNVPIVHGYTFQIYHYQSGGAG
jgi:hypothetical protein